MLYLITNRSLVKDRDFLTIIEKAAAGGVDAVILREKDLPPKALLPLAQEMRQRLASRNVRLIINSCLETAKAIKAEGFHMSFHDFMEGKPDFEGIIGVSVHSVEEAAAAEEKGADYLLAGHVFETDCKIGLAPRGTEFIQAIKARVKIPVIALGGIHTENVSEVFEAGADGAAVMSYLMAAEEPEALARALKDKIKNVKTLLS